MTGPRAMVRTVRLVVLLAAFWLVLSGHYEPLLLGLGAVSIALVVYLAVRTDLDQDVTMPALIALRLPLFFGALVWAVLTSATAVVRLVWTPRLDLRPVVGTTPADLPVQWRAVYANAITLTPGTLSLSVHDDGIEVHSLDATSLEDLDRGTLLDPLRRWKGAGP